MSPYEIVHAGGSVEHWNEEAGAVWFKRVQEQFPRLVWLNPEEEDRWHYTSSIQVTNELLGADRMFTMTLPGLERAMRLLTTRGSQGARYRRSEGGRGGKERVRK